MREQLIPITSAKAHEAYAEIWRNLQAKNLKVNQVLKVTHHQSSSATKKVSGQVVGVKLTAIEVAMLIDSGYSWFGGTSILNDDGSFFVTIYID